MSFYRQYFCLTVLLFFTLGITAQSSGTYSTYSRFGIGLAGDGVTGFNRGMGGVGIALHSSNRINSLNPASYATIDSLSFLFDVGASFSFGKQSQGGSRVYTRGASFEYVVAGFRLKPGLGLSFGFMPYTTIKYNFRHESSVGLDRTTSSEIDNFQDFDGSGGTHRAFVGVGWQPFRKLHGPIRLLSLGADVNIIWGSYEHNMIQSFLVGGSTAAVYSTIYQKHSADILTYKLDFGLQLPVILNGNNLLRTGFTASLGHNTGTDAKLERWTSMKDTTKVSVSNAIDIPYAFGLGVAWENRGMLSVAADYRFEKWGDCSIPESFTNEKGQLEYKNSVGYFSDRHRINLGAEFYPAVLNRGHNPSYLERCRYRIGAFYSTPYMKVNYSGIGTAQNGPSEYGITAGVGLPITNRINNRSTVNISFQWLRRQPSSTRLITENYYMIHVGISFNERWFMKYKIE
jgi:hypothetical protein